MKKNKSLVTKRKILLKDVKKEIDDEYLEAIKGKVKRKYKQVQMARITYEKLQKELDEMLQGKKEFTEEDLLFEDDE